MSVLVFEYSHYNYWQARCSRDNSVWVRLEYTWVPPSRCLFVCLFFCLFVCLFGWLVVCCACQDVFTIDKVVRQLDSHGCRAFVPFAPRRRPLYI